MESDYAENPDHLANTLLQLTTLGRLEMKEHQVKAGSRRLAFSGSAGDEASLTLGKHCSTELYPTPCGIAFYLLHLLPTTL